METILELPFDLVTTSTITRYTHEFVDLVPNKEVTLLIKLYSDETHIKEVVRKIEGSEFNTWIKTFHIQDILKEEIDKLKTPV